MRFLRCFFTRLSNFATGRRVDQRLQDELVEHLASQTDENLGTGRSPAEARHQAALKLGATAARWENHHPEQSLPFLDSRSPDLRYAIRMLVRSPRFSLIVIATMAPGIGATTATYGVIEQPCCILCPTPTPANWCASRTTFRV